MDNAVNIPRCTPFDSRSSPSLELDSEDEFSSIDLTNWLFFIPRIPRIYSDLETVPTIKSPITTSGLRFVQGHQELEQLIIGLKQPNLGLGPTRSNLRMNSLMDELQSYPDAINDIDIEGDTSAVRPDDNLVSKQASSQDRWVVSGSPISESLDSASLYGDYPRSPSPWQAAGDAGPELSLTQALSPIVNSLGDEPNSRASIYTPTDNSETTKSPGAQPVEGVTTRPGGSGSGPSSCPTAELLGIVASNLATGSGSSGLSRTLGSRDSAGDSGDGDEDEPIRKRPRPAAQETPLVRPRFACPYQKYDPLGAPYCCMQSGKNPRGGAETFTRVK